MDFNNNHQCYIIQAGLPGQGLPIIIGEDEEQHQEEEQGCVHFDLKRTCGSGTSPFLNLFLVIRLILTKSFIFFLVKFLEGVDLWDK